MKLHHIGVAVKDLDEALKQWSVFGLVSTTTEEVSGEKVRVAFLGDCSPKIELLEPTDPSSVIEKFLQKRGEGLHHLCYEVEDIEKTMQDLISKGATFTSEAKLGSQGSRVSFIYPKHLGGVLVELRQV